jgi:hypothetical protein
VCCALGSPNRSTTRDCPEKASDDVSRVAAIRSDRFLEADSGPASRAKSTGEHITVDWVAVGRRIRETRGFDMTQGEFAGRIGIRQNYLSVMERGKVQIGTEILLRISREFAKRVAWLLLGKG